MKQEIAASKLLNCLVSGILDQSSQFVLDGSLHAELASLVDENSLDEISPEALVSTSAEGKHLLDFGCGTGGYRAMLESFGYQWSGVNYKEGMAPAAYDLASQDPRIKFYDGRILPFSDDTFDVVFSLQVFEHIQDIGVTFSEIARILKRPGRLIGSVSYLEQMHDYSTFNFTPYGLKIACQKAGLRLQKIYPRRDVFSWMFHRLVVMTTADDNTSLARNFLGSDSVFEIINRFGKNQERTISEINLMKLLFSSHVTFQIEKVEG